MYNFCSTYLFFCNDQPREQTMLAKLDRLHENNQKKQKTPSQTKLFSFIPSLILMFWLLWYLVEKLVSNF